LAEVGGASSSGGAAANSSAAERTSAGYVSSEEAYMVVRDLSNREYTMLMIDLKIKAAAGKDGDRTLTAVERTILLAKSELNEMRMKRAAAKVFIRHLESNNTMVWPDAFQNLPHIEGVLWDEVSQ
jgi:hypothetical protein